LGRQSLGGELAYIITNECIMCDACVAECPENAISVGDPAYKISAILCNDCGACAEVCPTEACIPVDDDE
jgi:ferredoxin